VGPGWLVLRAIAPGVRSRALQLALGWPIGLTLEILAFALTAATGVRDLFWAYPLLVAVPAVLVLVRREREPGSAKPTPTQLFTRGSSWALAGLCLLAFAFIGLAYFTTTPLPGSAPGVSYPGDATFHISVAASALHDWPPSNFRVVGESFNYHYFANLHMAAISQVTGIHLPLIVFRLYPVPLAALLVLQLGLAGRLIAGRLWAGPLTVALFLLIGPIDLSVSDGWPFAGIGVSHLWSSPSQLLAMVFFVPILFVLGCLLDPHLATRASPHLSVRRRELWAVLALLLVGAGGAKSIVLPMLIAALGLYLLWTRLRDARIDSAAVAALGLCVALLAVYYLLMYRGSSLGLRIDPPATLTQMPPLERVHAEWPNGQPADAVFWILALPIGTAMYFAAPLLGLAWFLRSRSSPLESVALLSLSLLLVGAGAFLLLRDEYVEQTYVTVLGLIAVFPLAALGLTRLGDTLRSASFGWARVVSFMLAWLAVVVGLALLADRLAVRAHFFRADLVTYTPLALAGVALALGAIRAGARLRAVLVSLAASALLLTAALDTPLDVIPHTIRKLDDDAPLYTASSAGLRPRELEGMEWIRDHLDSDAVLAVSNDTTPHTEGVGPVDSDYPAFTEHRTFREGWDYTAKANEIGQREVFAGHEDPFPERTGLERAVFLRANPAALRTMVDKYGVTHIVVSKKDGAVSPRVYRLGRLVYSNGAVDVIELPR
jgi:hypothetical protein